MTAARAARLGDPADGGPERAPAGGVRVVLDARPLQEPDRAPLTAAYLDAPARGLSTPTRSMASRSRCSCSSDLDDPTTRFEHLDVVGRRLLPPTRLLRSGALTVDPFLLSGASLGAAWRADRAGAAGAVYHAAGGSIPLATGLPLVVTLLDLAPWELPGAYQRRPGRPVRAAAPRPAAAGRGRGHRRHPGGRRGRPGGCSGSGATGSGSIPLAPRPAFHLADWTAPVARPAVAAARSGTSGAADPAPSASGSGCRSATSSTPGRYDARQDLATLLRALARAGRAGRPDGLAADDAVAAAGAPRSARRPDDRAALARAAAREERRRGARVRAAARRRAAGGARPRRPGGDPARRSRTRRAAGARGDRLRRRRSSPRPSGRCPRSSGLPGSSSSRATRSGSHRRCATAGPTIGSTRAGRGRPRAGRRRAPDLGGRRRRDAARLRRGRRRRRAGTDAGRLTVGRPGASRAALRCGGNGGGAGLPA